MKKIKNITRPLILVGLTILFSVLLSLIPRGTKIINYKLKHTDMFLDIKPDSIIEMELNDEPEMEMQIKSIDE